MPEIGELIAGRFRVITPDKDQVIKPAARGGFPLGLARQAAAGPGRVRLGIFVGHMHNRVIFAARHGRPLPSG